MSGFKDDAPIDELMAGQIEEYYEDREKEARAYQEMRRYIKQRLEELRSDERLTYPPASCFENAPLALQQVSLKARIGELERIDEMIRQHEEGGME